MATSPNYGWSEPDNTDLVKNGALAIRTLGNAIDTSVWNVGFGQAGKNKIINGDFRIWQRGTTVTPAVGTFGYGADRWRTYSFAATSSTLSQQTFTPGTAPVAGYEGQFFARVASTNTVSYLSQPIEDVRTFAGQTVTLSFWAKSASAQSLDPKIDQDFGSGGSALVSTAVPAIAITTSWARYSATVAIPSISGKTIGTSSFLDLVFRGVINNNLDIWGVQLEYGSKATPFQTASGGSKEQEEAMCQRYYYRLTPGAGQALSFGNNYNTIQNRTTTMFPVEMRIAPTALEQNGTANNYAISQAGIGSTVCSNVPSFGVANTRFATVTGQVASGLTAYNTSTLSADATNGATAYLGWSAEL